ncbi:GNAT family N-acetyltransferase [Haloimpatiens sp. FM7330]|uniref:GNAT family N-acetyltransferase n=1 Tax=Haloimpatiens sp. FM7330 TaxID=3298610 RepID=UPI00362968A7
MCNIYFRDIDNTNEDIVRRIKLKHEQVNFIETVDECLEEANTWDKWHPVAIHCNNDIIGFAMYGSFGPNKDTWIDRIMIDKKYQCRGFGRIAMMKLIDIVSKEYGVNTVYLSVFEQNILAYNLYKSIGFKYINEKDVNGELIFQYTIK